MKIYSSDSGGRIIILRLNKGDLLRESIEQAIKEMNIMDGTIVCGYGALSDCCLHMIQTFAEFPAQEKFPEWKNHPFELVSVSGVIADGVPHIHAIVADSETCVGGHLEYGCTVAYLGEIVIYEHVNLSLTRKPTDWGPLALVPKEQS